MNPRILASTLAALAFALPAAAQTATPRVDQRQANQERRIDQGVHNGTLSKREARRLDRNQRHVDAMENRAKRDGVVTRRERARMQVAQDRQSRKIYRQKHDGNRR